MQPLQVLSAPFLDPEEASLCKARMCRIQQGTMASHTGLITHLCSGLNLVWCKKGKMDSEVHTLHPWTAKRPQTALGAGAI